MIFVSVNRFARQLRYVIQYMLHTIYTYNSRPQFGGLSIRYPDLRSCKIRFVGVPGYGMAPRVIISHNKMPKAQLQSIIICIRLFQIIEQHLLTYSREIYSHVAVSSVYLMGQSFDRHPF